MVQARINLALDELEEMLEQRREERVQESVAQTVFRHQVQDARIEREQRRSERALETWASLLVQRSRLLRHETDRLSLKTA